MWAYGGSSVSAQGLGWAAACVASCVASRCGRGAAWLRPGAWLDWMYRPNFLGWNPAYSAVPPMGALSATSRAQPQRGCNPVWCHGVLPALLRRRPDRRRPARRVCARVGGRAAERAVRLAHLLLLRHARRNPNPNPDPNPDPNPNTNPNPNPNPDPIPNLSFSPNSGPNQACSARAARLTTFGSRCGSVSATPTPGASATQPSTWRGDPAVHALPEPYPGPDPLQVLGGDMRQYTCCQGYFDCCCFKAARVRVRGRDNPSPTTANPNANANRTTAAAPRRAPWARTHAPRVTSASRRSAARTSPSRPTASTWATRGASGRTRATTLTLTLTLTLPLTLG